LRAELAQFEAQPTEAMQPLRASLEPMFFGAGGPHMAGAGVELAFDMTRDAVVGLSDVLKKFWTFRRRMLDLRALAVERQPHAIICIDFSGFNLRLARAVRRTIRSGAFQNWNPKIIQFVSPQVWASRPKRAKRLQQNVDLLLSIFPFEKEWYHRRVPKLHVEFVGHPMVDRFLKSIHLRHGFDGQAVQGPMSKVLDARQQVLLLPGSRMKELQRHLPVILGALKLIREKLPQTHGRIVLPDEVLASQARALGVPAEVEIQIGKLSDALATADLAIASTGTVTMECAFFGVPTVTLYKTSGVAHQGMLPRIRGLLLSAIAISRPTALTS
jgi:lipid-A-disaccharide synthase